MTPPELFAWMDEDDDVVAGQMEGVGMAPFVAGTEKVARMFEPFVRAMVRRETRTVRLVHFRAASELDTITSVRKSRG